MSEDVLCLTGIEKAYNPGQPGEVRVLSGVDLTLKPGELVGLVAPSGAGKSTLLHLAGLLDRPDAGEITLNGRTMSQARDGARTRARRQEIGFVYQFHHLLPEFSATENITLPQRANGVARSLAEEWARDLLNRVGLDARRDHRPAELSGGEQQRVAVCRALANRPRLLLADEPTGNLDPETAEDVFELLLSLARQTGLSALIATHNLALAERMDRVLKLSKGSLTSARAA